MKADDAHAWLESVKCFDSSRPEICGLWTTRVGGDLYTVATDGKQIHGVRSDVFLPSLAHRPLVSGLPDLSSIEPGPRDRVIEAQTEELRPFAALAPPRARPNASDRTRVKRVLARTAASPLAFVLPPGDHDRIAVVPSRKVPRDWTALEPWRVGVAIPPGEPGTVYIQPSEPLEMVVIHPGPDRLDWRGSLWFAWIMPVWTP